MLLRDMTRDVAKVSDLDTDWDHYRTKRNLCTSLQKKDKNSYYKSLITRLEETNDSKKLFSTTKQLLGSTSTGPPSTFLVNGKLVRKQQELADTLAEYYTRKVSDIKYSLPGVSFDPLFTLKRALSRWKPTGGRPKFSLKETTTTEVLEMIKSLKNSHAYGRDLIDSATVKLGAETLAPVFKHVINLSISSQIFPQKWKLARILPLQKARDCDRLSPNSFCPIAQLPLISKLTERVV